MEKSFEMKDPRCEATIEVRLDHVPKGLGTSTKVIFEIINGALGRLIATVSALEPVHREGEHKDERVGKSGGHTETNLLILETSIEVRFGGQIDPVDVSEAVKRCRDDIDDLVVGYIRQAKIDAHKPITAQIKQVLAPELVAA